MNKMNDKHRYHSSYRTNNSDDGFKQRYKYRYQYRSPRHNNRLNNNLQQNQYQQSKSNTYSYSSAPSSPPPLSLMSNKTTLFTAIPQERESWTRSVKKTNINESTEQKTQYLETILRMSQQQKSSMNSSTFDRIRFANDQISTITNTTENNNNNNLDENSLHLIGDMTNHDEICTIENILFDNKLQTNTGKCSTQITHRESTLQTKSERSCWSAFLIDNCDEEETSPLSPPPHPPLPLSSAVEESIQPNQEDLNAQRVMLLNELDAADTEQRQELKRQKRLHKKMQKKKRALKVRHEEQQAIKRNSTSTVNNKNHQEVSSDWIIEYNAAGTDQISQLTDMIRRTSTATTDEDKISKMNLILKKIKKQQIELRKLRQHVMSMLNEEQNQNSTNISQEKSHTNQDLLMTFLNQPITSGCWLCSGKTYTEVATQCNNTNE